MNRLSNPVSSRPHRFTRRVTRNPLAVAWLCVVGLVTAGCGVTPEKHTALRLERDALSQRLQSADSEVREANARAASYESQLRTLTTSGSNSDALMLNKDKQIAELQATNTDLQARYQDAIAKVGQGSPLPAGLTSELTRFADANPELVTFDARTGIIRFKSEVTFASGDAALTSQAQEVIARFGQILQTPAASNYEVLIAGHTDNQKVSAATQQRGHRDNWQLSAHRAISVAYELIKQGVEPRRIGAAGHGEYRPVASNETAAGKAQNRRVEVMLLPRTVGDGPVARPAAAPANPRPTVRIERPELGK